MNDEQLVQAMVDQALASLEAPVTAEDVELIRKNARDYVEEARAMRRVTLANGDEPDFVFHAHHGEARNS